MSREASPKCCCPSPSARRCYEISYPPPIDDFERSRWYEDQDILGTDECECGCHEPEYVDDDEQFPQLFAATEG